MTVPGICPVCRAPFDEALNEAGVVTYDHENDDGTYDTCEVPFDADELQ